jgi:hypothetical protein
MSFNFDAFAGALRTLSETINKAANLTGIPREALTMALRRQAAARDDRWEEHLWKFARSDTDLSQWIYRQAKPFDTDAESEILKLAEGIPFRIRRNLMEIARRIPASPGGKRPALNLIQIWRVRSEVKKLHRDGRPKDQAYKEVAKRMRVSAHTIRRICDERERQRSREASQKT